MLLYGEVRRKRNDSQEHGSVANTRVAGTAGDPGAPSGESTSMASSVTRHALTPLVENFQLLLCGIDTLDLGLHVAWNNRWPEICQHLEGQKQKADRKSVV